ncbi:histidine kinase [Streptomyces sp. NPDC002490]|uniref:histidine kinase n=1 Tax=Streptomyces sp. NPDC002490 TaxID=3154416 RepID=UPI0033347278
MPSFDLSRYRFRLSGDDLGALILIAAGEAVPDQLADSVAGLRDAGLIWPDGRLAEALQPLITTVLDASAVIGIETAGPEGGLAHGVLVGEDGSFSHEAWPGESESEYVRVDRNMLVWELARMVNLQRTEPPTSGPRTVTATLGALDGALGAMGTATAEQPSAVRTALSANGVPAGPELERLAELIVHLRCSWRITAAWPGDDGTEPGLTARGFAVWDCGGFGYWHRELPAEPVIEGTTGPSVPLRLVAIRPRDIWEMLAELLPDAPSLTAARVRSTADGPALLR